MRSFRLVLILVSLAALIAGCGLNPKGSGNGTTLRVANLIFGSSSVNVTVGTKALVTGSAFQGISGYADSDSGSQEIKVAVAGSTTNLIDSVQTVSASTHHTFIAYGTLAAAAGVLLNDEFTSPGANNFALRLVNVAASVAAIDLYVTSPGASIDATAANVSNLAVGGTSAFVALPVGNYEIRITRGGTKEVIFDVAAPAFAQGIAQTLVAYSLGSSKLVNVAVLGSDNSGNIANNLLTEFKVLNASSVASPLNIFLDGSLLLSNIPYLGVSGYEKVTAGTRRISVEATSTPGATLVSISPTLGAAQDASIVLTGAAGALATLVLADGSFPVAGGPAQVRFVNVADNGPALDVFVNFSKQVSALAPRSASAYVNFDAATAGTVYQFDFNTAGTTALQMRLPGVTLASGHIYTIYVVGPGASPTGVVTQDL
jgi:hypothetical protein